MMMVVAVASCGDEPAPDAEALCEKAADRYGTCIEELLGPEMAAKVEARRDIDACAGDERTVEAYRTCLSRQGCDAFMDCVMDIATGEMPE